MPRRETRVSRGHIYRHAFLAGTYLIGAYISQDVHLRCVYLMGVAFSKACITVPKPSYPNCVPSRQAVQLCHLIHLGSTLSISMTNNGYLHDTQHPALRCPLAFHDHSRPGRA
jgi:hypothetical protein